MLMKIMLSGERTITALGGIVILELLNGTNGLINRNLNNGREEWSEGDSCEEDYSFIAGHFTACPSFITGFSI